ncbi:MAG TPA: hypothetical protein VFV00_09970 [Acidimicrobiales bacterium]|nr:hypothetical protein [Acidimicrobiales bacterium]
MDVAVTEDQRHPAVVRLERDHDIERVVQLLVDELTPADLTALLLEVAKRRAARVPSAQVLQQYRRDRFVRPVQVDIRRLLDVQQRALDAVDPPFEPVGLSPLVPFGTSAALAEVNQNRIVTAVRNTEVLSDPTTALALEAAVRRRESALSGEVVRLGCVERIVRAQSFDGPRSYAHFSLLALVSAGRGSLRFDQESVGEHITALAAAAEAAGVEGVQVAITDFSGTHGDVVEEVRGQLRVPVSVDPYRAAGRSYYPSICFTVMAAVGGDVLEVGDGGLVDWTQALVGSKKERLMTSALSLERIAALTS